MPNYQQSVSWKNSDDEIISRIKALADTKRVVLVAIDGNCCSGKTTMAVRLGEKLGANVFHLDDYFLQPHMRTPERLSQPGGNVDADRFLSQILLPASRGEAVKVQKYDCHADALLPPVSVSPQCVVIAEGAYSLHPLLSSYYDLKIFCRISPDLQETRSLARNGAEALPMFQSRWIPLENAYFTGLDILSQCDIVIDAVEY